MASREVLIKSMAQAIPSYCMSIYLFSHSLCDEIQKMINSFCCKPTEGKGIRWMCWDRLLVLKEDEGMGFRDLQTFNLAFLAFNLFRVFKARYFPRRDFLNSVVGHNPSYVWRSI